MEFIYSKKDENEIYSYVKEYKDGYGFSGVYLDKKSKLFLVYAPEDRENRHILFLYVTRDFIKEHKDELNDDISLKQILPETIRHDIRNFIYAPSEYFEDKAYAHKLVDAAEKGSERPSPKRSK